MALLSEKTRKSMFDSLGLGEYNKTNIKKLQKMYLRPQDIDGVYGVNTDRLLRHIYNVRTCAPDFKPTEFKCECGGRYCTGYPTYMKKVELRHIQKIRDHYKKPMTVTCGMRCKTYNSKLSGSVSNSLHLVGRAVDFYMPGVTDTLANRKKAVKYIKALPNHHYTYGNGINSNGYSVYAPYMGNALHTDVNKAPVAKTVSTKAQELLDACKTQIKWMKSAQYGWESKPTIEKSKKKGTCVTFVSVVLQRVKVLKSGQALWHNGKGYGTGKVTGANDLMQVDYMGNKTISSLKDKLKAGDIILLDDNKSGVKGSGGHIMILSGTWKGSDPYVWDMEPNRTCIKTQAPRKYSGQRKVLARVRIK